MSTACGTETLLGGSGRHASAGRVRAVVRRVFYLVKPLMPRRLQIALRRALVRVQRPRHVSVWPIDPACDGRPDAWRGWPMGKRFALVLTHDVETAVGRERCLALQNVDRESGFRSSFNFVPADYHVPAELRARIVANGGEVGVHGLHHDGKLFSSWEAFQAAAGRINSVLAEWGAVGFRAPAMHHELDWIRHLDVEYDASTFDTDPFEAQPDGVGVVFPFWVPPREGRRGYVELPYTLPQDFTLFALMQERTIDVWTAKLDWLVAQGGMALLNTHPDYMDLDSGSPRLEEYPVRLYREFLSYVARRYEGQYWNALPRDVARFWKKAVIGGPAGAPAAAGDDGART